MSIKNYGISGIGSNIQLGKRGGYLNYNKAVSNGNNNTTPAIQLFQFDNSSLIRLQVADPLTANDAATKKYVDGIVQGLNLKASVYVASIPSGTETGSGNIALTGSTDSNNQIVIDGVEVPNGSRVLLKDQTDATQNGIYVLTIDLSAKTYTFTRSTDADNSDSSGNTSNELSSGCFTFVETGLTNADTGWVLSSPIGKVNIGVDSVYFVQFSSAGVTTPGNGLVKEGVVISVNPDNVTVYTDANNKVAIKASTDGLVMVSSTGDTAVWDQVDLTKGVKNTLPSSNGGTGISSYGNGDILYGMFESTATGGYSYLSALAIGSNGQSLSITSGLPAWNYQTSLYNKDGTLTITSTSSDTNTSYLSVNGSDTGKSSGYNGSAVNTGVTINSVGVDADINLTFNPKGNGVILARSGYSSFLTANYSRTSTDTTPTIPDDSLATIGFVMGKIIVPDTTKIYHENSEGTITSIVDTNNSTYPSDVVISCQNHIISTFSYNSTAASPAVLEEHLNVSAITGEVQLQAIDSSGTNDVDIRIIPQAGGFVYLGTKGSGLVQSEDTYTLTVSGGAGTSSGAGGNLILKGGDSSSTTLSGGNVYIQGGKPDTDSGSTSTGGDTFINDSYGNKIIQFTNNNVSNSVNYLYVQNSPNSTNQGTSGIIIGVSPSSVTTDVSMYVNPKGQGLLRVYDADTYLTSLKQSGNDNAFVTRGYVDSSVDGVAIPDGHGLTNYTDNGTTYRGLDFGTSKTIGFDSAYNVIVTSGSVGTVLVSQTGSTGNIEAKWQQLDISNTNSITGTLATTNGGTGITSYTKGDMLYASDTNVLSVLSASSSSTNQVITITNGVPSYQYVSTLYDTNGNILLTAGSLVTDPINYISILNASSGSNPSLTVTSSTTNNYLGLNINTGSSGLVYVNSTYVAALSDSTNTNSNNALVPKGYVDSQIISGSDPMMILQNISSNYSTNAKVGTPKEQISNRKILVSRVEVDVQTVMSGGSIDSMSIYVGSLTTGTKLMDTSENDILVSDLYIKDLTSSIDISGNQIYCYFFDADGNATTPTAGNINIIVHYNIL